MKRTEATGAWERIARSYSETRNRPWHQVVEFLEELPKGSRVLDLGCGNGRHTMLSARMGHDVVGLDASGSMAAITRDSLRKASLAGHILVGDLLHLPIRDGSADAVLLVASLHTIPGVEARHAALVEAKRVVRPGGLVLVTCWARWQQRFFTHFLRDAAGRWRARAAGRDPEGELGDIVVPWRDGTQRFYHLMSLRGLTTRCVAAGFLVRDAWSERIASRWLPDNHFAVVQKPPNQGGN